MIDKKDDKRYKNDNPIVIKNGKVIPDNLNDCFLQRDLLCREFKYVARISRAIYSNSEEQDYKEFCDEMMEQMMERRVDSILLKYGKKRDCVNLSVTKIERQLEKEKKEEENRDKDIYETTEITEDDVKNWDRVCEDLGEEKMSLWKNAKKFMEECKKQLKKKKKHSPSAKNKKKPVKKKK